MKYGMLLAALSLACIAGTGVAGSSWVQMTNVSGARLYPSCMALQGYIYCIGGGSNITQIAPLQANGSIPRWYTGIQYPNNTNGQVCANSPTIITCVGGTIHNTTSVSQTSANSSNVTHKYLIAPVNRTYYSVTISTGINSNWEMLNPYPFDPKMESCVASSTDIYCIGGYEANATNHTNTNLTYYSALPFSGSPYWIPTTTYPKNVSGASCVVLNNYIYCIGGHTSGTYYAQLDSNGSIGDWKLANQYPYNVSSQSCVGLNLQIYCIGGLIGPQNATIDLVYSANVLPNSNLTKWLPEPNYPIYISDQSCTPYNSTIYCVGGLNRVAFEPSDVVYAYNTSYAPVNGTATTTIGSSTNSTISTTIENVTTSLISPSSNTTTSSTQVTISIVNGTPGNSTSTLIQQGSVPPSGTPLWEIIVVIAVFVAVAYLLYLSRRNKSKGLQQST